MIPPSWGQLARLAVMAIIGWGLMLGALYIGARILGAL